MGLSCPPPNADLPRPGAGGRGGGQSVEGTVTRLLPGGGNTGAGVPHGGSCFPQLHGAGPLPDERKVGPTLRGSGGSFSPFHAGHPAPVQPVGGSMQLWAWL